MFHYFPSVSTNPKYEGGTYVSFLLYDVEITLTIPLLHEGHRTFVPLISRYPLSSTYDADHRQYHVFQDRAET